MQTMQVAFPWPRYFRRFLEIWGKVFSGYALHSLHLVPLGMILTFILFMPSTMVPAGQGKLAIQESGNAVRQLVLSAGFMIAMVGLLFRGERILIQAYRQKLMFIFLGFTLLSIGWSDAPWVALKRWSQFAGMLAIGWCALGKRGSMSGILELLRGIFTVCLLASIATVVAKMPSAFDPYTGAWTGIHGHKNTLGQVAALTFALWAPVIVAKKNWQQRLVGAAIVFLSIIVAWKSGSVSSQFILAGLIGTWALMSLPIHFAYKILLVPIPLLGFLFWYLNFPTFTISDFVLTQFERDATLTGRTILWPYILEQVDKHFFFGVGYNSFWIGSNQTAHSVTSTIGWDAGQAHNGYIDILNEIGFVGALLFLLILFQVAVRTVRIYRQNQFFGMTISLILLSQIMLNLSESSFCRGTSPGWFVFLMIYAALALVPRNAPRLWRLQNR